MTHFEVTRRINFLSEFAVGSLNLNIRDFYLQAHFVSMNKKQILLFFDFFQFLNIIEALILIKRYIEFHFVENSKKITIKKVLQWE